MLKGFRCSDIIHRLFAALLMLSVLSGGKDVRAAETVGRPTNFVLIFTDDQGYADVGCLGAEGFQTPNLDRMAREGMLFTDFHVSHAVCSPSRAALLTGCCHPRIGIYRSMMPWVRFGLNPNEQTIAELLRQKGYVCGIFGKWHVGSRYPFLPLQQGFDVYVGLPYSNDMWPVHYDGRPVTARTRGAPPWKRRCPPLPIMAGNTIVDYVRTLEDQNELTTLYTEQAAGFIRENRGRPFFLYVPHSMPHVPLGVSERFRGKSRRGFYGDVIMEIDWSVGRILAALRENGVEDHTLVIFTSDNGPWRLYGNHAGSAEPLRGFKNTLWEGGSRVPCIMRWPGVIEPGSVCAEMASTIDLLPTLATIAGAALPEKEIDGVNILPLLRSEPGAQPRKEFLYYFEEDLVAVRRGPWKLVFPHEYLACEQAGADGWPGKYVKKKAEFALYHLERDIREQNNVLEEYPDIVAELRQLAGKARRDLGDRLQGIQGGEVRPAGRINP